MKKEQLTALGIAPELAEQAEALFLEEIKSYVKQSEYDLKAQELLAANTSIQEMKEKMKNLDGVDVEALRTNIKTWEEKYNTDISGLKEQYALKEKNRAVETAILQAKGRNPKTIKALIDMDKVNLKDDGTLEGLDLESLKQSDSYLFALEEKATEGTGFTKGNGNSIDTSQMTYSQMVQYAQKNPNITFE